MTQSQIKEFWKEWGKLNEFVFSNDELFIGLILPYSHHYHAIRIHFIHSNENGMFFTN